MRRRSQFESAASSPPPFSAVPPGVVARHVPPSLRCADVAQLARVDKRTSAALSVERALCDPERVSQQQRAIGARYLAGALINAMRRSLTYPIQEGGASPTSLNLELATVAYHGRGDEFAPGVSFFMTPGQSIDLRREVVSGEGDDAVVQGSEPVPRAEFSLGSIALTDWLYGRVLSRRADDSASSWTDASFDDWLRLLDGGADVDGREFLRALAAMIVRFGDRTLDVRRQPSSSYVGAPLTLVSASAGGRWSGDGYVLTWIDYFPDDASKQRDALLSSVASLVRTNDINGYEGVRAAIARRLNVVHQDDWLKPARD